MPQEPEKPPTPAEALSMMINGFVGTQVLYAAAKLTIFDILRDEPKTLLEIATLTGSHEPSLRRLLGYLTTINILTEDIDRGYAATEMGELLQSDHPQSLYSWAMLLGAPFTWKPWGELYQTIKTGKSAFERVFEEPFFQYLEHHPEDAALFNAAMTQTSSDSFSVITEVYDFSDFTKIVDVGGGQGGLLRGILEKYPNARGVLYDQPSVVATAHEIKGSAVEDRCNLVGGDMFESVPVGGDAYIMKMIIHDWDDAAAIRILRNCNQAMSDHGKILIVDSVLKPNSGEGSDLMMMVMVTGRERTEEEFRQLYEAAGLKLTRIIPTATRHSIIEGVRI